MNLFEDLKSKIRGKNIRIVFPEGTDIRVLGATVRLKKDDLVEPVLLGDPKEIQKIAKEQGIHVENLEIIDPNHYDAFDEMVQAFVERRKGKATEEQARELLKNVNYFGTMLTYLDKVDGLISGAVHTTGDTVRPALQIIKAKPGNNLISGAFLMLRGNEKYLFSDCAINIAPTAEQLAEIAVQSVQTAEFFGIEPHIAMLSFSTKGSAKSDEVTKVQEATKLAQQMAPNYEIDGELQFDAAFVESVAQKKAPQSKVAGKATVFVFPEIQSGNIGYKIAQRLGNFEAIGPILQGLNKPISDLSRGCNEEDVYKLTVITASQTLI
ncbi:phosphate acetyltransferase [Garciella nitratireducens]|uniref:phosphate acetyltransferase n=1 Tax=Garciella nitratireducens TaxID=218205 RepID=UPI000DEB7D29|nr:phosphate acetyltransferase [Garciella nitratireducens]RBP39907.1 phosphotransacetylase [Garciella nitratireducens]